MYRVTCNGSQKKKTPRCRPPPSRRLAAPEQSSRHRTLASIPAGNGIAPVAAKRAPADAHAGRGLAALVFVALDQVQDAGDHGAFEAAGTDLVDRQVLLDEGLQDRIEQGIGRERISVLLVRPQLRARLAFDHAFR